METRQSGQPRGAARTPSANRSKSQSGLIDRDYGSVEQADLAVSANAAKPSTIAVVAILRGGD